MEKALKDVIRPDLVAFMESVAKLHKGVRLIANVPMYPNDITIIDTDLQENEQGEVRLKW